jgi:cell division transport system permease protein
MFLSFFRVIKFSLQDIARNIWLSLVTIIILILALFTVNMLLVVKVVGDTAVDAIKEKIDINLFVKNDAEEPEIKMLEARIRELPNVRDVSYISKADALENFKLKYKDNPEIIQSLSELGQNPLTPTVIIKPDNLDNFDTLVNHLNSIDSKIIESRNFTNYELMLEKINSITDKVEEAGIFLSSIFILITLLVVYNSVRVAIYTHQKEITIMKLVGASNSFIQMPYLFSSLIYTLIGISFVAACFYPFLSLLQPYLEAFFVGYRVNLVDYFYGNFIMVFGIQFLVAALVNGLTSLLAVRKYSKV